MAPGDGGVDKSTKSLAVNTARFIPERSHFFFITDSSAGLWPAQVENSSRFVLMVYP